MYEDKINEKNEENNLNVNRSSDRKTAFIRRQVIRKFISDMISLSPKSEMNASEFTQHSLTDLKDVNFSVNPKPIIGDDEPYSKDKKFISFINTEAVSKQTLENTEINSYDQLEKAYNDDKCISKSEEMFLSFYAGTSQCENQKNVQNKENTHHESSHYSRNSLARIRRREKRRQELEEQSTTPVPTKARDTAVSNFMFNSGSDESHIPLWNNLIPSDLLTDLFDSVYGGNEIEYLLPFKNFIEEEDEIEQAIQNSLYNFNSKHCHIFPMRMETIVEETPSNEALSIENLEKINTIPSIIITPSNYKDKDILDDLGHSNSFIELEKYKDKNSSNDDNSTNRSTLSELEVYDDLIPSANETNHLGNSECTSETNFITIEELGIESSPNEIDHRKNEDNTLENKLLVNENDDTSSFNAVDIDINSILKNEKSKADIFENKPKNLYVEEKLKKFIKTSVSLNEFWSSKTESLETTSKEEVKTLLHSKRGLKRKYSERLNLNLRPNIDTKEVSFNKIPSRTNLRYSDVQMNSQVSFTSLRISRSFPSALKGMNGYKPRSLQDLKLSLTPSKDSNMNRNLRKLFSKFRRKNVIHPYQPLTSSCSINYVSDLKKSEKQICDLSKSASWLLKEPKVDEDLSIQLPNACSQIETSIFDNGSCNDKLEVLWPVEREINIDESNSSSNEHRFIANYTSRKLNSCHSLVSENPDTAVAKNKFLNRLKLMRNTDGNMANEHLIRTYQWLQQDKTVRYESSESDLISNQDHCGLANPSIFTKKIVSFPDVESFLMSLPTPGFEVQQTQKKLREYLQTSPRSSSETFSSYENIFPKSKKNSDTFVAKAVTLFDVRNDIKNLKETQTNNMNIKSFNLHDDSWQKYRYITTPSDCNSLMTQTDRFEISNINPNIKNKCIFLHKMKQTLSNFFLERKKYFE